MSSQQIRIRNLSDLQRYKLYLRRRLNVRQKILNARIRKVERELTVPNVTRELFRGSQWELILPPIAEYLGRRFSGKSIFGLIAGVIASLGSIKLFSGRRKTKKQDSHKTEKIKESEEDQLFI